jgi:hypothetical protein
VFNASTGINPNSGLLANASQTDIQNNGLPRSSYSEAIDGVLVQPGPLFLWRVSVPG